MAIYLCLIALFLCAYYWLPKQQKDSPWVWLILFGGFAVISVSFLSPKYSQTQGQLETRFHNRETALAWQGEAIDSPEAVEASRLQRASGERNLAISLEPIFIGLAVVILLGLFGIAYFSKKQSTETLPSPEPDSHSPALP